VGLRMMHWKEAFIGNFGEQKKFQQISARLSRTFS
jgi:hypothetical protein